MSDTIRLFVVEDCEVSAELIRRSLIKYSAEITIDIDRADSIAEAMDVFTASKYAAALIDWNLPDGDGVELARDIVLIEKTLPIIFLSALFSPENINDALEFNPGECVVKDYSDEFTSRVMRHIAV